jgi:hypothetical protein
MPASDTYTVKPGIGTISGRAIYALGEAGLRRMEMIMIRTKLTAVRGAFPHGDDTVVQNIEAIYDNVLELSRYVVALLNVKVSVAMPKHICRPGLSNANFRKQALKLLLSQIGRRKTRHLLRYLMKWPVVEIALFLSEVMACMPLDW